MLKVKYLWTLALVVMFAGLASGMAFATPWVSLDYTDGLTATAAATMLVPAPGPFMTEATFPDVSLDDPDTADVNELYWAWAQIEECADAATASEAFIVQGYGDGSYQPTQVVTRGQMAVFIARAAGYTDDVDPDAPSFFDVNNTYWAFEEIERCVLNDVVQGYVDYVPDDPDTADVDESQDWYLPAVTVDRAQMAVFIGRAAIGATTVLYADAFDDVAGDFWAADWIQSCVDANIVAGYPDYYGAGLDGYLPDNAVTRAQMAVFVWRSLVRDAGCVVLGGPAVSDDAWLVPALGEGEAELFLPDVVTATGANTVDDMGTPDDPDDDEDLAAEPGAVVFVALDAVQVPDGDIVFEVSHVEVDDNGTPDDDTDDVDVTVVDDDATVTVDNVGDDIQNLVATSGVVYLVASYQIPAAGDLTDDGLPETYTVTVTLPNGAVLDIGEFEIAAP